MNETPISWQDLVKEGLLLVTLLLAYFSFENFAIGFLEALSAGFFSKVAASYPLDILLTGTLVYLLYRIYIDKRFTQHLIRFTTLLVTVAIIYIYQRALGLHWQFLKYELLPFLAYMDLIVILPIALGRRLFLNARKRVLEATDFLEDLPIDGSDKSQDSLGYFDYAKSLAEKLQRGTYQRSFAAGVCGAWGSGKTSFVNILKNQFDPKSIIWVDFNPWHADKPPFEEFFDTVEAATQKISPSLSRLISEYARTLEANTNSNLIKLGLSKLGLMAGKKSQPEYIEEISKLLLALNRKLVIVIDDLDRLEKGEIVTLMKIIRNTANFKNTIFIGLYDKKYLCAMLTDLSIKGSAEFSEKVFQLEVHLPQFDKQLLTDRLYKILVERIPNIESELKATLLNTSLPYADKFKELLSSNRDVIKLANTFSLNYNELPGDLNVKDLLFLELLKLKHYEIYSGMREYKEKHLKKHYSERNAQSYYYYSNPKILPVYLSPGSGPELTANQKFIKDILTTLFDLNDVDQTGSFPNNSISYPSHFDRYFYLSLNETAFSEREWIALRKHEEEAFITRIQSILSSERADSLNERLFKVRDIDNPEDFKKIIHAQLISIDTLARGHDHFRSRLGVIMSLLKKYGPAEPGSFSDPMNVEAWLYTVIEKYQLSSSLKLTLMGRIRNEAIVWTPDQIDGLEEYFIKQMLKGQVRFPEKFWEEINPQLLRHSYLIQEKSGDLSRENGPVFPKHLADPIKDFALKNDLQGLLEAMIPEHAFFEENPGLIRSMAGVFFGGEERLITFLKEKRPRTPEVKEMLKYLEYKETLTGKQVPFEFKILKPKGALFLK